jgi:hypothetical protein
MNVPIDRPWEQRAFASLAKQDRPVPASVKIEKSAGFCGQREIERHDILDLFAGYYQVEFALMTAARGNEVTI